MAEGVAWPVKTREVRNHHLDSTAWDGFRFRDDDIVIASHPKSGTTWLSQVVAQLLTGGSPDTDVATNAVLVDLRAPPPDVKASMLEGQSGRRCVKTCLPVDALVFSPKAKYVFVGRDARDVIWSLHNHHVHANQLWYDALNGAPGLVGPPIGPPPADVRVYWREWFERDGHPWWPFWEFVRGWWAIRGLPNVHLVHYADLKRDFRGEASRLAEFLGVSVRDEAWGDIQEHCTMDWMRQHGDKVVVMGGAFWDGGVDTFINKGTNGRWAEALSGEECAAYEARAVAELGEECARWLANGMGASHGEDAKE